MMWRLREAVTVHKEKEELEGNIEMAVDVPGLFCTQAYKKGAAEESCVHI